MGQNPDEGTLPFIWQKGHFPTATSVKRAFKFTSGTSNVTGAEMIGFS